MIEHDWQCVCGGTGEIEAGPSGATYSDPCPGPPERITKFGVTYARLRPGHTVARLPSCTCPAGKGTNPSCPVHP